MATYSIDDGDGNQVTTGIGTRVEVERIAQEAADLMGRPVYWYEEGEEEMYEVVPEE
jgi:hypothetical protein